MIGVEPTRNLIHKLLELARLANYATCPNGCSGGSRTHIFSIINRVLFPTQAHYSLKIVKSIP